jgi:CRP-like cAMP-binding protein
VGKVENHLVERLPPRQRRRFLDACEPCLLVPSDVLSEPGRPARHLYFPITGFLSLVAPLAGQPGLEIDMVGREGMIGSHLALGIPTAPWRAQVRGVGTAWRIPAAAFEAAQADSPALRPLVNRYLQVRMTQLAASAACLHFHLIAPRLAKCLLTMQDCAQSDRFHVTHELLADMLGVRRVGITVAAGSLQRNGLIAYHRGTLTVRDRSGLEAAACGCYANDRRTYRDLLP